MAFWRSLSFSTILLLLIDTAHCFYLPGVASQDFQKGDQLQVKVNKLTSTKTQLPYSYYSLPICAPPKIKDSAENLGEVLCGMYFVGDVGGTKFAECFVSNQRGHLSKNCPQNTHGIYPKGGCYKICGGVTHLAKDCPEKGKKGSVAANGPVDGSTRSEMRSSSQVTKFVSGDDIEDDFMTDEIYSGDKNKSTKSRDYHVKTKEEGS